MPDDLARTVEVDERTVERWLRGRTPHPRHRVRVAKALGVDELEIWPDAKRSTLLTEGPVREIAGAWPHASDPGAPDWRELLDAASERIELLDFTLQEIVSEPGVVAQLAEKATHGVKVRILIGDPDSAWAILHDQELGPETDPQDETEETIRRENLEAREHLQPLLSTRRVEVREFLAQRFNTILRFDEHMLVTLHLYGNATPDAPVLYLRRRQENGLFDQFAGHFERIWEQASEPLEPHDDYPTAEPKPAPEHDRPPSAQEAQNALDRLRAHRPP